MNKTALTLSFALFCAAALRPAVGFCDEEEKKDIYLPSDISKTLTFKPLKDQQGSSVSKSSDTTASSQYLAAPSAQKSTTYIFVNKDDDNQKRWTTPSKKKSGATASKPATKTKIKKLEVSRAGFADTSFTNNGGKSGLKDRKDDGAPPAYKDDKVIVK